MRQARKAGGRLPALRAGRMATVAAASGGTAQGGRVTAGPDNNTFGGRNHTTVLHPAYRIDGTTSPEITP